MNIHVLLYDSGTENEGIHSLEIAGKTVVLMFEARDDAERYKGLLEAQDFPIPSIEIITKSEIEIFCEEAGYEARFVEAGFIPKTDEDRLLISPPERNLDVNNFAKSQHPHIDSSLSDDIDSIKKRLEDLI